MAETKYVASCRAFGHEPGKASVWQLFWNDRLRSILHYRKHDRVSLITSDVAAAHWGIVDRPQLSWHAARGDSRELSWIQR